MKNVIILESVTFGSHEKEESYYNVCVKCNNCGNQYQATLKKGTWVSDAKCINCNKQELVNN
jgi:hypothetical protein